MTDQAQQFFNITGGTPTSAEVALVEAALNAGKGNAAKEFAEAFDRAVFPKARQDRDSMYGLIFRKEDVVTAFAEAKKAIGL